MDVSDQIIKVSGALSDQMINVLDAVCQKFGIAVDWTQNNIAPYVQDLGDRIVKYEIWTSVAWIVIFIVCIVFLEICRRFSLNRHHINSKAERHYEGEWILGVIISSILMIVLLANIAAQCFDIIQAIVLPEKTWIDFIQSYMDKR